MPIVTGIFSSTFRCRPFLFNLTTISYLTSMSPQSSSVPAGIRLLSMSVNSSGNSSVCVDTESPDTASPATCGRKHDDVIRWKHLPRYWPFVGGNHQWTVTSHHKGQWHGALVFPLICAWTNSWANNRNVSVWRSNRTHYVTAMKKWPGVSFTSRVCLGLGYG